MSKTYLHTKNNLLKLKKIIKQYKSGQKLLEEKELILKKKRDSYLQEEKELKEKTGEIYRKALYALQMANVDIGLDELLDISNAIKEDDTISIKYVSLMGVEIPSVVSEETNAKLNYGLYHTTSDVDKAILEFVALKQHLILMAQNQNTIIRLQKAIEKVQRRSNALKEIIIPNEEKTAREIQSSLDEAERDEFVRMKKVKQKR